MMGAGIRLHKYNLIAAGFLGLAVLFAPSGPATAQSGGAQSGDAQVLNNRLERLERDIRTISRQVYRGEQPGRAASNGAPPAPGGASGSTAYAARIAGRLSQMEDELRQITGEFENFTFVLDRIGKRLDKLVSDVDFRLSALESRMGPDAASAGRQARPSATPTAPPTAPPVRQVGPATGGPIFGTEPRNLGQISGEDLARSSAVGQPEAAAQPSSNSTAAVAPPKQPALAEPAKAVVQTLLPKGTPEERYRFAFSLIRQADYAKAEIAFREFIAAHPKNELTANARYWLGETYYVRRDFLKAMDVFLESYQKNQKGRKAIDSLLKLGMSLNGLEQNKEACATYDKLAADNPVIPASLKKVLARERKRAKCK